MFYEKIECSYVQEAFLAVRLMDAERFRIATIHNAILFMKSMCLARHKSQDSQVLSSGGRFDLIRSVEC